MELSGTKRADFAGDSGRRAPAEAGRGGLTLIELLVVVAIVRLS